MMEKPFHMNKILFYMTRIPSNGSYPTQTLEDYFLSTVFFSTILSASCVLLHLVFLKILRRMMDARLARQYQLSLRAHARDTFNDHVGGNVKFRLMVKGTTLKVSRGGLGANLSDART